MATSVLVGRCSLGTQTQLGISKHKRQSLRLVGVLLVLLEFSGVRRQVDCMSYLWRSFLIYDIHQLEKHEQIIRCNLRCAGRLGREIWKVGRLVCVNTDSRQTTIIDNPVILPVAKENFISRP
jgi:hypothetical protein